MHTTIRFDILVPLLTAVLIFAITALVGVWAAPDRTVALLRLALFGAGLLLMMGLAWSGKRNPETALGITGLLGSLVAAAITIYFLLTVNWAETEPARLPLLHQFGLLLHNLSPTLSEYPNLHKNLTGGVLAILLPLGLSGVLWARSRRYRTLLFLSSAALLLALLGLLMTGSRGAWLGLGLGLLYAGYLYWRFGPGEKMRLRRPLDLLMTGGLVIFLGSPWLALIFPELESSTGFLNRATSVGRVGLWRDLLPLIQDYPFTGAGLGDSSMLFSTYIFLLHVPFLSHAHNLFLQIAIEQGLPGLIAFLAMSIIGAWGAVEAFKRQHSQPRSQQHSQIRRSQIRRSQMRHYGAATLATILAMLQHGTVDSKLYVSSLMPVMFLPFGFALALLLSEQGEHSGSDVSNRTIVQRERRAIAGSLVPMALIVALFLWPNSLARLEANLGAVAQSRAELSAYSWPAWPLQDELRRSDIIDLAPALTHYQQALTLDPANVTARRRLGQIALSRGEYDVAQEHLEAAFRLAPTQRATRQMLGELYAIRGDIEQAVRLWQTIDTGHGQLDLRRWWHAHIGASQQAKRVRQAIIQLDSSPRR